MAENNGTSETATTGTKRLGGVTGKGWMPGQSGNPKGRSVPSYRKLIQDLPELTKQEQIDRMTAIIQKGRPGDAIRALALLARHSADTAQTTITTETFTITIEPSAAMGDEDDEDA